MMQRNPALALVCLCGAAFPLWAQQPSVALHAFKGKEILDELRLREATAIKAKSKPWARELTSDRLRMNVYADWNVDELTKRTRESGLKDFTTTALFEELNRRAREKAIFGADDRQDLFVLEAQRDELLASGADASFLTHALGNAKAVCCLVNQSRLARTATGTLQMATKPFVDSLHDTLKLCPLERFSTQPTCAFCTGFLVKSDVIVTAGHCVNQQNLANFRIVFGYRMVNATTANTAFPESDVYLARELLGRALDDATGEDWSVVRLDRPVAGIAPLKYRAEGRIADSTDLYVIGFPSGLPCKIAANARVNQNSDNFVFTGNLDTYRGNSGSPVFNRSTHEVEGILVRGGQDFQFVTDGLSGCIRSVVLADSDGNECCTRATVWSSKVP